MPITIQPTTFRYKKQNGTFVSADSIKGDKGERGERGEQGPKGDPGQYDIATVAETQAIITEYGGVV